MKIKCLQNNFNRSFITKFTLLAILFLLSYILTFSFLGTLPKSQRVHQLVEDTGPMSLSLKNILYTSSNQEFTGVLYNNLPKRSTLEQVKNMSDYNVLFTLNNKLYAYSEKLDNLLYISIVSDNYVISPDLKYIAESFSYNQPNLSHIINIKEILSQKNFANILAKSSFHINHFGSYMEGQLELANIRITPLNFSKDNSKLYFSNQGINEYDLISNTPRSIFKLTDNESSVPIGINETENFLIVYRGFIEGYSQYIFEKDTFKEVKWYEDYKTKNYTFSGQGYYFIELQNDKLLVLKNYDDSKYDTIYDIRKGSISNIPKLDLSSTEIDIENDKLYALKNPYVDKSLNNSLGLFEIEVISGTASQIEDEIYKFRDYEFLLNSSFKKVNSEIYFAIGSNHENSNNDAYYRIKFYRYHLVDKDLRIIFDDIIGQTDFRIHLKRTN